MIIQSIYIDPSIVAPFLLCLDPQAPQGTQHRVQVAVDVEVLVGTPPRG